MRIKIVRVLLQVEVADSTPQQREQLESFLEQKEADLDEPLYDGVNTLVKALLEKAKKFDIAMKGKGAPVHDFDIDRTYRVLEKP